MAKIEVRWTKQALEDLESAREYVLDDNPSLLDSTIQQVLMVIQQIINFPDSGRVGRVQSTKELILTTIRFIIVYRKNKNIVEILALLYQSRKWP
ncbi:MAG: type II toxin-antitoxin system RelE/ParE family toxin [Bacteriovoracia bacterium]